VKEMLPLPEQLILLIGLSICPDICVSLFFAVIFVKIDNANLLILKYIGPC